MGRSSARQQLSVMPAMFLYFSSYSLSSPGLQQLLYDKLCFHKFPNQTDLSLCHSSGFIKNHPDIQQGVSTWSIYITIIEYLPAIVVSMYMGIYCDKISPKGPMMVTIFGHLLSYGVSALQAYYIEWNTAYLLLAGLVNGLTGSFIGLFVTIMSILSKNSSKSQRSSLFIVVECFLPLGIVIAKFSAGYILQYWGTLWIYLIASGLMLLNLLVSSALVSSSDGNLSKSAIVRDDFDRLVEDGAINGGKIGNMNDCGGSESSEKEGYQVSKQVERETIHEPANEMLDPHAVKFRHLFRFRYWQEIFEFLIQRNNLKRRIYVWTALLLSFLNSFSSIGCSEIFYIYYTKELGNSETEYGNYSAISYGIAFLGALVGPLFYFKLFKMTDLSVIVLGFLGSISMLYIYGIANLSPMVIWLSVGMRTFFVPANGCLKSILSKEARKEDYGKMFCLYFATEGLTKVASVLAFNALYNFGLNTYPGLSFFVGAGVGLVGLIVCVMMSFTYEPL